MNGTVELSETTKQVIKDLQDDLNDLLTKESNIEVIWKLEELSRDNAFLQSAELIRKSLKK